MRPSPRDADMRAQDGMPPGCEFHPGEWVAIAVIIAVMAWVMLS
jgi:hypothetical protein